MDRIYNISGEALEEMEANLSNLNELPNGIYFIQKSKSKVSRSTQKPLASALSAPV